MTAAALLVFGVHGSDAMMALPSPNAILDFIARYEAPSGYDQTHNSVSRPPPRPLTKMTLTEVLDWQESIRPKAISTAAGRYQIIHDTLARLVRTYRLDPNRLFSPATQDELGRLLIRECGYGRHTTTDFANCLAGIWAALPKVSGPDAGRSAWAGTAGNRALVTPATVLAFLGQGSQKPPTVPGVHIQYEIEENAVEESIRNAHENDDLGRSVVIRFTRDPYRTH
ncbi:MAG: hypothetical protein OXF88_23205 [Rhodobacteraceae bacterium]|nr:hypothetical protein [Paracoccaceae bacterium]